MMYNINNIDCNALQPGQSATDQQMLTTVDHVSYTVMSWLKAITIYADRRHNRITKLAENGEILPNMVIRASGLQVVCKYCASPPLKKYFCPLSHSAQKQSKIFFVMARRNIHILQTHKAIKIKTFKFKKNINIFII